MVEVRRQEVLVSVNGIFPQEMKLLYIWGNVIPFDGEFPKEYKWSISILNRRVLWSERQQATMSMPVPF